jgi:hypothetical protein
MESGFGQDFSRVRIHADPQAAESARVMHAAAYTVGRSIVFAPGRYAPASPRGRSLLAHELTHVVQQEGGTSRPPGRLQVDAAGSAYEREASDVASRIAAAPPGPAFHGRAAPNAPLSTMRQPTISRMGVQALQRSMEFEECVAPSEVVGTDKARQFGDVAETMVEADYCAKTGCNGADEYFDVRGKSPRAYIAFLVKKNYGTVPDDKLVSIPDWLSRPDILAHKPAAKEFYEIKPGSAAGESAGKTKIKTIETYMASAGLPYVSGVAYNPTAIPLGTIPSAGMDFEGFLKVWRSAPGLLLYKLCVKYSLDINWEKIGDVIGKIVLGVLAFFAMFLGLRGGPVTQPAYGISPIDPGIASNEPGAPEPAGDEATPVA